MKSKFGKFAIDACGCTVHCHCINFSFVCNWIFKPIGCSSSDFICKKTIGICVKTSWVVIIFYSFFQGRCIWRTSIHLMQFQERKVWLINPNWHKVWKQEKYSSLVTPWAQWAWQGVKLTLLMSIFTSKKVLEIFGISSAVKILSEKTRGWKGPSHMPIRVTKRCQVYRVMSKHFAVGFHNTWIAWVSQDPKTWFHIQCKKQW